MAHEIRRERVTHTVAMVLLVVPLLVPCLAHAADRERVELYDTRGRRTGYAIVDRESGRVDYYDVDSRRTGHGTVDATGRAERFDTKGRRQEGTVLPVPRTR